MENPPRDPRAGEPRPATPAVGDPPGRENAEAIAQAASSPGSAVSGGPIPPRGAAPPPLPA